MKIKVETRALEESAQIPRQAHHGDAGSDISTDESGYIRPGQRRLIGTGIAVAIPEGYVGYIKPRSGLAFRHGIDVLGGVIDSHYRGEIKVILLNTGESEFRYTQGDRIAQLVIQPVASVNFVEVPALSETVRGDGGFGSTGVAL